MEFSDPFTDPETPEPDERPPRRERPPRQRRPRGGGSGGGSGAGQQLMVRRAIALGAGLIVLVLLVFGAKGCLDARKNRSLEDYAGNVSQIVNETNSLSESFFGLLDDPGDLSVTDFTSEVESDRSAMDGFLSRVEKLSTPGDMKSAQSTLTLVYQLRASAMEEISSKMPTALGNEGKEAAIKSIAAQMQTLNAADVLYNQVTRHQIDNTLESNGAQSNGMPRSQFVPDPAKWLDPGSVEDSIASVSGAATTPDDPNATHGTGLSSVTIGAITLDAAATTTIPAGTEPTVTVQVENQGTADETDVTVGVSVDGGTPIEQSIDSIAAGATGEASIALTPAPTGTVTLDVDIAGVDGEAVLENNTGSFSVNFG